MKRLLSIPPLLLALLSAGVASAQEARAVLADPDLDSNRGGFVVAGDIAFQFGAVVRTFENGELALQTSVNWTSTGAVVDQLAGAGVVADRALGGMAAGASYTTATGASVIHNVANGQLANILSNTASQTNFRQETNATLVLPGFQAVQGDIGRGLAGLRIADDVSIGAVRALGQ